MLFSNLNVNDIFSLKAGGQRRVKVSATEHKAENDDLYDTIPPGLKVFLIEAVAPTKMIYRFNDMPLNAYFRLERSGAMYQKVSDFAGLREDGVVISVKRFSIVVPATEPLAQLVARFKPRVVVNDPVVSQPAPVADLTIGFDVTPEAINIKVREDLLTPEAARLFGQTLLQYADLADQAMARRQERAA